MERPLPAPTVGGVPAPVEAFELLPFGHPDAALDSEVWLCPDCWFLDPPEGGES